MSAPEVVFEFHDQMPTGVTVADDGRIFVCYPRWGDPVEPLRALLARGAGALWVTQDERQARRMARRRLLVEAGRVREAGWAAT